MADTNISIFSGRLTSDPNFSDNGVDFCRFDIANNRYYKGEERTTFIPIKVFGPQAKICYEHLKKGDKVIVQARLEIGQFTDKEGNNRKTVDFIANNVDFAAMSSRNRSS